MTELSRVQFSEPRNKLRQRTTLMLVSLPLLLVLGGKAVAQQPAAGASSYDVELIIFRNLSSSPTQEATSEKWGEKWGEEWDADAHSTADPASSEAQQEAAPVTAPSATFPALPASKLKLVAINDTLRRSRHYVLLAHFGWTQPGYARNEARFISIDSVMKSAVPGLNGRIALARSRYLHLTLDLALDQDGHRYRLQTTRRMRSTERHYIDHPKFGVIALITPSE